MMVEITIKGIIVLRYQISELGDLHGHERNYPFYLYLYYLLISIKPRILTWHTCFQPLDLNPMSPKSTRNDRKTPR
jgi:hypothetical protein